MTNQTLARRDGKFLCKRSNGKRKYSTFHLQGDVSTFREKNYWPKMTWNCDLSLLKNFVVNVECATVKYEIIRKPMVLERVEVNPPKSSH